MPVINYFYFYFILIFYLKIKLTVGAMNCKLFTGSRVWMGMSETYPLRQTPFTSPDTPSTANNLLGQCGY